ncbi:3-ketoacyl-ACP reductase [Rhizobium alvei]|uniref:3-ketoacyl-ACP reductase n=1 Tax=Rhizobium alvei TaxID=1132659 RepID=A0ABT8YQZ7_9HYPH|nr:3-ketoacyl-ACP reductase [Rhizobium alvei]MDO6966166.1 3-ketoacyl-ACP reductase [Rhizobium alvei]
MRKRTKPVALVTGGRQGLGRAIAIEMADKGFDLVIMDLVADERADETLATLAAKSAAARFVTGDLADLSSHSQIIEEAWNAFGGVDCLVNNAGVAARPLTDILDLSPEAFDFNLGINLRGTFFLTQAMSRKMLAEPDTSFYRSVIFITSIAAEHVSIDRSQYCVSKAGLSMTAKLYAVRLAAAGIHVHEVRPGFIKTDMTASASTAKIDAYIESGGVPLRRWGRPEDVGATTATLASGAMPYLNGQAIYVDGAFHLPIA